jgi:thymidylate synthase
MMWVGEAGYLNLLATVLEEQESSRPDRTNTGTLSVFGEQLVFRDIADQFPLYTTKKVPWKPVVSELLWFLEGSTDERRLAEILYDKPREELDDKNTIWTANANADFWLPKAKFNGDVGKNYSSNWRDFGGIDQIAEVVRTLKEDPFSRRHIVSAWNPPELNNTALPPCHVMFQFYVSNDYKLSCQVTIRSNDLLLGNPFNVASYALLTCMIAQVCGYKAKDLILNIGDSHIYLNHTEQVKEQITREILPSPTLWLNPDIKNIFDFKMSDIKIKNYQSHPAIKALMAV